VAAVESGAVAVVSAAASTEIESAEAVSAATESGSGGGIVARAERLELYALVQATRLTLRGLQSDKLETDWDRYVRRAGDIDRDLLFPFRDGDVGTVLTPAARLPVVDVSDPRIAEALRATVDGFRRMRDRCAGRAEVAVVLIPTKELVYAERVRASGTPAPEAYDRLVESEERMWAEARAALDAAGVPWIETLGALRDALARGENPYQMNWDGHPNVVGYDEIAAAVDHLEDVVAFLVVPDLVGQLAPAPRLGLLDRAVVPRDDRLDLVVQRGHLLVARVRRDHVHEFVLACAHDAPSGR